MEPAEVHQAVGEPVCAWGGKVWGPPSACTQSQVRELPKNGI